MLTRLQHSWRKGRPQLTSSHMDGSNLAWEQAASSGSIQLMEQIYSRQGNASGAWAKLVRSSGACGQSLLSILRDDTTTSAKPIANPNHSKSPLLPLSLVGMVSR